jgi:hypothetical protein
MFQCLDVFGEGLAAGFGNAIEGLRLARYELLFDSHVPGFFELEQLRAQVASVLARSHVNSASSTPLSSESRASRSLP